MKKRSTTVTETREMQFLFPFTSKQPEEAVSQLARGFARLCTSLEWLRKSFVLEHRPEDAIIVRWFGAKMRDM